MKVLFIGGTGLISTATSKKLIENGYELYLLNRGNKDLSEFEGAKFIKADINDEDKVKEALGDLYFDCVVNWVNFEPKDIERDIRIFTGKCKQYIFISSSSAYQKPVVNPVITESTPLVNPYWEYSRNKAECEDRLLEENRKNGFPYTVVRPSFTYGDIMIPFSGEGNSWNHPWSVIDRILKGKEVIVHGDGTAIWTMTHNTDFAKGMIGLIGNSNAIGQAFHITSDELLSWNQIMQYIGKAVGKEVKIVHIPTDFLIECDEGLEGDIKGDKMESVIFDNSKLKSFVPEYIATMRFEEGVKRTVEYFKAHPEMCTVDEQWDKWVDDTIAKYRRNEG